MDWIAANRANWDERVPLHLASEMYDLAPLRAGRGRLSPIEEAELGDVAGLRVLHLQCHFGCDTLALAQRGADATGLDFSGPAIAAARALARELGLSARARFIEADVYAAPEALPEEAGFDLVYVTWGALVWLPDMVRWAELVARCLKPGGRLYLAEAHTAAYVFDDAAALPDGRPGFFAPYFQREPLILDETTDYADDKAVLVNTRTYQWMHPLSEIVTAILAAGMRLDWLREHDAAPWRMFACLVRGEDGLFRWPDKRWLPLAFSLSARRPG